MFRDHNYNGNKMRLENKEESTSLLNSFVDDRKETANKPNKKFMFIAVSGSLQDGFPLRKNLDYYDKESNETTNAIFLGWGLVRGLKSYFDIKTYPYREHMKNGFARINPGMIATGNPLDANVYAIYLIDVRAGVNALLGEPRYLGMVPDFAQIDLQANETSDSVKKLMQNKIESAGLSNKKTVSITTVISVWKGPTFVENPVLYTKEDGTRVTNFHEGLAKWAGTNDSLRGTDEWQNKIEAKIREQEWLFTESRVSDMYCADGDTLRLVDQLSLDQVDALSLDLGNINM